MPLLAYRILYPDQVRKLNGRLIAARFADETLSAPMFRVAIGKCQRATPDDGVRLGNCPIESRWRRASDRKSRHPASTLPSLSGGNGRELDELEIDGRPVFLDRLDSQGHFARRRDFQCAVQFRGLKFCIVAGDRRGAGDFCVAG